VSDVSVLSHEYKASSELSRAINHALILVKKQQLGLLGAGPATDEAVVRARRDLSEIVAAVAVLLGAETPAREAAAASRVPGVLVARLRSERRGDLDWYLEDLTRLAGVLADPARAVSADDLALLDQLAAAADAETSAVFRKLMRT